MFLCSGARRAYHPSYGLHLTTTALHSGKPLKPLFPLVSFLRNKLFSQGATFSSVGLKEKGNTWLYQYSLL